jgi:predicted deacylase
MQKKKLTTEINKQSEFKVSPGPSMLINCGLKASELPSYSVPATIFFTMNQLQWRDVGVHGIAQMI